MSFSPLHSGEWTHAEFKAAHRALLKSVIESVSAFANTRGGWIVLGVTQDGERFEVSGVAEPDKVQNDFPPTPESRTGRERRRMVAGSSHEECIL